MEHFRVLPTDPRIKGLSDNQISLLMQYWLDFDERAIREVYRERKAKEEAKPKFRKKDLMDDLGFTEEEAEAEIERLTRGQ